MAARSLKFEFIDGVVEVEGASPELLRELLTEYRQLIASMGFPVDRLVPGPPGDRLRSEVQERVGLTLPDEVLVWFEWCNGPTDLFVWTASQIIAGDIAIRATAEPEQFGFMDWNRDWFLLFGGAAMTAVECVGDPADPPRVIRLDPRGGWDFPPNAGPTTRGLSTFVAIWIQTILDGVVGWDGENWTYDRDRAATSPFGRFL